MQPRCGRENETTPPIRYSTQQVSTRFGTTATFDTHSNQKASSAPLYSVKLGNLWAMVVRRLDTPPVEAFEQGFELGLGHGNVCLR